MAETSSSPVKAPKSKLPQLLREVDVRWQRIQGNCTPRKTTPRMCVRGKDCLVALVSAVFLLTTRVSGSEEVVAECKLLKEEGSVAFRVKDYRKACKAYSRVGNGPHSALPS